MRGCPLTSVDMYALLRSTRAEGCGAERCIALPVERGFWSNHTVSKLCCDLRVIANSALYLTRYVNRDVATMTLVDLSDLQPPHQ